MTLGQLNRKWMDDEVAEGKEKSSYDCVVTACFLVVGHLGLEPRTSRLWDQ